MPLPEQRRQVAAICAGRERRPQGDAEAAVCGVHGHHLRTHALALREQLPRVSHKAVSQLRQPRAACAVKRAQRSVRGARRRHRAGRRGRFRGQDPQAETLHGALCLMAQRLDGCVADHTGADVLCKHANLHTDTQTHTCGVAGEPHKHPVVGDVGHVALQHCALLHLHDSTPGT